MRLLLVEDDPVQLRGLCQYLADRGHFVIAAATAKEAEERLASVNRYDAAIIDVCIPGGSGAIVLHVLHEIPGYKTLPIIMTTGLPPSDLQSLASLPNVAILQKPFDYCAIDDAILQAKKGK